LLALAGQSTAAALASTSFLPHAAGEPFRGDSGNPTEVQGRRESPQLTEDITGPHSLKVHAAANRLLTGCAVVPSLLDRDADYTRLVREQASILVAENAMKWGPLRPSPSSFDFEQADLLMAFAQRNGMKLRGHNLCWHRQLPGWFATVATPANARQLLVEHIERVAGRYAGRMHSWDVVNEAIEVKDGRSDGFRLSPWLKLAGGDYVELAFRTARRADSQALLTYNDYGIEDETPEAEAKRSAVLKLLRRMRARRVPIDAVGIQSHIAARPSGTTTAGQAAKFVYGAGLTRFLASARELDLQVFLTEMDVNDRSLPEGIAERDAAVAEAYARYLDLVLRDPAVTAVLTWGITDRYTWLNHEDGRSDKLAERPLPFDVNYQPKPAFLALRHSVDKLRPIHGIPQRPSL
jgi:endo-1,4-beta-xylanase